MGRKKDYPMVQMVKKVVSFNNNFDKKNDKLLPFQCHGNGDHSVTHNVLIKTKCSETTFASPVDIIPSRDYQ